VSISKTRLAIGVAVVIVALGVVGAVSSPAAPTAVSSPVPSLLASLAPSMPTPSNDPSVGTSVAPSDVSSVAPSAHPVSVLLTAKGNGTKSTKAFDFSGSSFDINYTYSCKAFGMAGNFQIYVYAGSNLIDLPVNELATKGSDTSTEYLTEAGPYHLEINSECAWTLRVTG